MSPQIHDSCYNDLVLLDTVNHSVWKTTCATPPVMLRYAGPSFGMLQNTLNSPLNLIQEL